MKFAKYTFLVAGIYGLLALAPQYFLEEKNGLDFPPAITHPEYYYGFVGVALAWQIAFLIVSRDPIRFRPLMLAAVLEKLTFAVPVVVFYSQNRVSASIFVAGLIDLLLGAFFAISYLRSGKTILPS